MSFTIGIATFTNGSKNVTNVSITSGRLSYFASGTRVVVGVNPVIKEVEAVKAPTNTEITLDSAWDLPSGTYPFLANMTSEGVRDAVQKMREYIGRVQAEIAALTNIYDSTALGIQGTASGGYFNVLSTDPNIYSTLYRNDTGTATLISSMPTKLAIDTAVQAAQLAESNASDSAVAAGQSETNAAQSEAGALASYNSFIERYYGPLAAEPTADPNGNLPTEGDLYFNTGNNTLFLYNGATWQNASTVIEGVYAVNEYTNIAGQTTIALTYDPGLVQVLYNGVQLSSADFTATNGTSIILNTAVESADDMITVIRWGAVTESTFIDVQPTANTGVQRTSTGAVKVANAVNADEAIAKGQTGTAYNKDVTTSATDTTAGRLLKVGAFGLGLEVNSLVSVDFNTLPESSYVNGGSGLATIMTGSVSTNNPPGYKNCFVEHYFYNFSATKTVVQIATHVQGERRFIRHRIGEPIDNNWSSWRALYDQGNIVGTVSQSGGVPTGSIIERGSNANGEYVKFADGTLICTRSATYDLKQSGVVYFASPELFSDVPSQHVSSIQPFETQQDVDQFCSAASNPSASSFTLVRGTDKGGTMNNINITLTAIGRWY